MRNAYTMLVILIKQDRLKNNVYVLVRSPVSFGSEERAYGFPQGCPAAQKGNLRAKLHDTAHCKVNNKAIS